MNTCRHFSFAVYFVEHISRKKESKTNKIWGYPSKNCFICQLTCNERAATERHTTREEVAESALNISSKRRVVFGAFFAVLLIDSTRATNLGHSTRLLYRMHIYKHKSAYMHIRHLVYEREIIDECVCLCVRMCVCISMHALQLTTTSQVVEEAIIFYSRIRRHTHTHTGMYAYGCVRVSDPKNIHILFIYRDISVIYPNWFVLAVLTPKIKSFSNRKRTTWKDTGCRNMNIWMTGESFLYLTKVISSLFVCLFVRSCMCLLLTPCQFCEN